MTLPDETEIVHSESMIKDGLEVVKVVVERPVGLWLQICRLLASLLSLGKGGGIYTCGN